MRNDFGFLVLFNGRVDQRDPPLPAQRHRSRSIGKKGRCSRNLRRTARTLSRRYDPLSRSGRGRPSPPEQSGYLLAWTEAIAASIYKSGVYLSGQPVNDSPGKTITTADDLRQQIATRHLHPVTLFVYQDACPPSNGCTATPPPISAAGISGIAAWQYAQSPRRPEITRACAKTYAADNNCYAPGVPGIFLDMNLATSDDPSHGR